MLMNTNILWTASLVWDASLGGLVVGVSTSVLLLLAGEVFGMSGLLNLLVIPHNWSRVQCTHYWRLVLVTTTWVTSYYMVSVQHFDNDDSDLTLSAVIRTQAGQRSHLSYAVAGFLAGWGTQLGGGCCLGHGIGGLGRWSLRGFLAVATFMATAIVTATWIHVYEPSWIVTTTPANEFTIATAWYTTHGLLLAAIAASVGLSIFWSCQGERQGQMKKLLRVMYIKAAASVLTGILFPVGMYYSRMAYPGVMLGFLDFAKLFDNTSSSADADVAGLVRQGALQSPWDPTLLFVFASALLVPWLAFHLVDGPHQAHSPLSPLIPWAGLLRAPLLLSGGQQNKAASADDSASFPSCAFRIPSHDWLHLWRDAPALVGGSVLFGIGWGMVGIAPGSLGVILMAGAFEVVAVFFPCYVLGIWWEYYGNLVPRQKSGLPVNTTCIPLSPPTTQQTEESQSLLVAMEEQPLPSAVSKKTTKSTGQGSNKKTLPKPKKYGSFLAAAFGGGSRSSSS